MSGVVKIESEVPFGRTIYTHLYLQNLHLDRFAQHTPMERNNLAWETVRKQVNPFFSNGTGFEGYLIGRCTSSEAALDEILGINQSIINAIARLYRFEYDFKSRLMKTLTEKKGDPEMIHIWSSYLGAELGRLRAQSLRNAQAQAFRSKTYKIVETLPPMVYHQTRDDIIQTYAVGSGDGVPGSRLLVTLPMLKPCQQDAWIIAENIGGFGHPLVRKLLDSRLRSWA